MLVNTWMSKGVMSIGADDSVQHAIKLQKENDINMLAVIEKGKLVGVVTDRDLKRASVSDLMPMDINEAIFLASKTKVRQVMTPHPFTVSPVQTIEEAADFLLKNKISGAPVVDDSGKIAGIITRSDVLKVLISVSGMDKIGYQFAFSLIDKPGAVQELIEIIKNFNGRIASVLSCYTKASAGFRNIYMRIYDVKDEMFPKLLARLQEKTTVLYYVDYINNTRTIFDNSK